MVAAGRGMRMGAAATQRPKCLLKLGGRTLLEQTVGNMRMAGCGEIIVVVGHLAELIAPHAQRLGLRTVHNPDFAHNNILHSLMSAREHLSGPLIVSYSDIWVEPRVYSALLDQPGDIVLTADRNWEVAYEGRLDNPASAAEKVCVAEDGRTLDVGKRVDTARLDAVCGEFLGLWSMSAGGTRAFVEAFDAVDAQLSPTDPFEEAKTWITAYATDLMRSLMSHGYPITSAIVEGGWAEFDTQEDVDRLPAVAASLRLESLVGSL